MNRTVVSSRDLGERRYDLGGSGGKSAEGKGSTLTKDDYLDRLVKYIPPDVIGAFLALEGTIAAASGVPGTTSASPPPGLNIASWVVFGIILIATPFYLTKLGGVTKPAQVAISTGAFIVWAIAYSGPPFSMLQIHPVYSTLIIGLYTFLIPLVEV